MKNKLGWISVGVLFGLWVCVLGCGSSSDPAPAAQETVPGQQSVAPSIRGVSIGVADLTAATAFYRDAIGMDVLAEGQYPDYLEEDGLDIVVLASRQVNRRDTLLVLMNDPDIIDPAYYTDNPDKLVFIVPYGEEDEFYASILDNGGSEVGDGGTPPDEVAGYPPGVHIGMAKDLNGYLIEMLAFPPAMVSIEITNPYIIGLGIGVSSLLDSREFYTGVLGLEHTGDLDVPGFMDEVELASPSGAKPNMVLMHYDAPKDYSDNPVKLVFSVDDADSYFQYVETEAPDQIASPLTTLPSGAITGYLLDLDGTKIQIVQPAP